MNSINFPTISSWLLFVYGSIRPQSRHMFIDYIISWIVFGCCCNITVNFVFPKHKMSVLNQIDEKQALLLVSFVISLDISSKRAVFFSDGEIKCHCKTLRWLNVQKKRQAYESIFIALKQVSIRFCWVSSSTQQAENKYLIAYLIAFEICSLQCLTLKLYTISTRYETRRHTKFDAVLLSDY